MSVKAAWGLLENCTTYLLYLKKALRRDLDKWVGEGVIIHGRGHKGCAWGSLAPARLHLPTPSPPPKDTFPGQTSVLPDISRLAKPCSPCCAARVWHTSGSSAFSCVNHQWLPVAHGAKPRFLRLASRFLSSLIWAFLCGLVHLYLFNFPK